MIRSKVFQEIEPMMTRRQISVLKLDRIFEICTQDFKLVKHFEADVVLLKFKHSNSAEASAGLFVFLLSLVTTRSVIAHVIFIAEGRETWISVLQSPNEAQVRVGIGSRIQRTLVPSPGCHSYGRKAQSSKLGLKKQIRLEQSDRRYGLAKH
jgi:hypothetical protein